MAEPEREEGGVRAEDVFVSGDDREDRRSVKTWQRIWPIAPC